VVGLAVGVSVWGETIGIPIGGCVTTGIVVVEFGTWEVVLSVAGIWVVVLSIAGTWVVVLSGTSKAGTRKVGSKLGVAEGMDVSGTEGLEEGFCDKVGAWESVGVDDGAFKNVGVVEVVGDSEGNELLGGFVGELDG